jgi:opacity protein-like surface antigen
VDDDGTDPAYGLGAAFRLTDAVSLRAEYELFDVGDLDDLNMWSAGVEFNF